MIGFTISFAAVVVSATFAAPSPYNIFEMNISPEEAQRYLNSPPFTEPQLSGTSASGNDFWALFLGFIVLPNNMVLSNDPRFRTAEADPTRGRYWRNERQIENTEDYVDEVNKSQQFQGQDGYGAYAYGYKTPQSSKVESRARNGDLVGSYVFKGGNDNLIRIRYWNDKEGFHQIDNLPKDTRDTAEVRQTRLRDEKAWQKSANAAGQNPYPQGEYNQENYGQEYQGSASEPQASAAFAQHYNQQASQAREDQAQSGYQSNQQQQFSQYLTATQARQNEDPHKGFFYSFTN